MLSRTLVNKDKKYGLKYSIVRRILIGIFFPSIVFFIIGIWVYFLDFHNEQVIEHENYIEQYEKILNELIFDASFQAKSIREIIISEKSKSPVDINTSLNVYWSKVRRWQKMAGLSYFYLENEKYYQGFSSNDFITNLSIGGNRKTIRDLSLIEILDLAGSSEEGHVKILCSDNCNIYYYQSVIPYDSSFGFVRITIPLSRLADEMSIHERSIVFSILRRDKHDSTIKPLIIDNKHYYVDYTSDLAFFKKLSQLNETKIDSISYLKSNNLFASSSFNRMRGDSIKQDIFIFIHRDINNLYDDILNFILASFLFLSLIITSTLFLVYLLISKIIRRMQLLSVVISSIGTINYKKSSPQSLLISPVKDEIYDAFNSADEINDSLNFLRKKNDAQSKKIKETLSMISEKYDFIKEIMHTADTAILTINSKGIITSLNKYAENLFDFKYNADEIISIDDINKNNCLFDGDKHDFIGAKTILNTESYIKSPNCQEDFYYSWRFIYIDSLDQTLMIGNNLTKYRLAQEKITTLAERDSLTNTYNRRKHYDILQKWLEDKKVFSLLFIDLNNFKNINDTLGHEYGDKILIEVSDVLRHVSPGDAIISRFGGDEFLVSVKYGTREKISTLCHKIIVESSKIAECENLFIVSKFSLSIGVSIYPDHGVSIDDLMVKADAAMYENKVTRSGTFHIYDGSETLLLEIKKQKELRQLINQTIANCSLKCYFQPIVNINDNSVIIYESLARIIKPDTVFFHDTEAFIIESERIKCIDKIDKFIFETSIMRASQYDLDDKKVIMTINFSKYTIISSDISAYVNSILNKYGFPASQVIIEITESIDLEGMSGFLLNLGKLKQLGVSLALDDYGSGYTSLEYLIKFPINYLKLDMTIVKAAVVDAGSLNIIKSILDLAKNLKMEVIVEGIENDEAYRLYQSLGVYLMQGFYFSKPMADFVQVQQKN